MICDLYFNKAVISKKRAQKKKNSVKKQTIQLENGQKIQRHFTEGDI